MVIEHNDGKGETRASERTVGVEGKVKGVLNESGPTVRSEE